MTVQAVLHLISALIDSGYMTYIILYSPQCVICPICPGCVIQSKLAYATS